MHERKRKRERESLTIIVLNSLLKIKKKNKTKQTIFKLNHTKATNKIKFLFINKSGDTKSCKCIKSRIKSTQKTRNAQKIKATTNKPMQSSQSVSHPNLQHLHKNINMLSFA